MTEFSLITHFVELGIVAVLAVALFLLAVWLIKEWMKERAGWYERQQAKDEKLIHALHSLEQAIRDVARK